VNKKNTNPERVAQLCESRGIVSQLGRSTINAEENLEIPRPEDLAALLTAPLPEGLFPVSDCDEVEFRELLATIGTIVVPRDQWPELLAIDDPAKIEAVVTMFREAGKHLRRESTEGYGMQFGNLALAYSELGKQRPIPYLDLAVQRYHELLKVFNHNDFPEHWATTQNNLGNAYSDLPLGDRGANLTPVRRKECNRRHTRRGACRRTSWKI